VTGTFPVVNEGDEAVSLRTRWFAIAALVVALASVLAVSGCSKKSTTGATAGSGTEASGSANSAGGGQLAIEGSDTMVNMAQAWAATYMNANPKADISVKGGGSGTGIAALINGTTDIATASRALKPEEISQGKSKGVNAVETTVALDGVAIIVNPANTVTGLTIDQLGKIYRGEVTNWNQVGGPSEPIVLLSRDPSSGTYEFIKTVAVGSTKNYAKSAKLLPSTQAIVDETKASPGAIGYVGVGYLGPTVKDVPIGGVKPSIATVQDKTYPLSRPLFMDTNGAPAGPAKALIGWILGPEGQKIVKDQGFVPLSK
jgi:phosphate transport system substrate-binding protein